MYSPIGIFGPPGSGKGIFMMYHAYYSQKPLYSNFPMTLPGYHELTLDFLLEVQENVDIFITEGWNWLNAHHHGAAINQLWDSVLFQGRKFGVRMFVDSQLERSIGISFREMFNQLVFCQAVPPYCEDPNYRVERFEYWIATHLSTYPTDKWAWNHQVLPGVEAQKLYPLYESKFIVTNVNNPKLNVRILRQSPKQYNKRVFELAGILLPLFKTVKEITHDGVNASLFNLQATLEDQGVKQTYYLPEFERDVYLQLKNQIAKKKKRSEKKQTMTEDTKALYG